MSVVTIKVTVPKLLLNPVWAVNAMNEGVETVGGTKRDLEAITKPWRTNVSFQLFREWYPLTEDGWEEVLVEIRKRSIQGQR